MFHQTAQEFCNSTHSITKTSNIQEITELFQPFALDSLKIYNTFASE